MSNVKNIPPIIATGICFLVSCQVFAQNQITYYIAKNGAMTNVPDSADHVRMVSDADSDTGFYNIKEYYRNGKLKLVGKTSTTNGSILQGQCVSFFPTGKRQQVANYKNNYLRGDVYNYYPNGKLYAIKTYIDFGFLMVACNDSTGKVLATEGNGYFIDYDQDFKFIREEGDITNGIKNGEWHGYFMLGLNKVTYTETYKNGELVNGRSVKNGQQYLYAQHDVQPEYKGGEEQLQLFLKSHIRYPDFDKNAHNSGMAYIQFTIDADGSVSQTKIIRAPSSTLGGEAARVVGLTKWTPGYHYGIPTPVQFTQIVNFSLSNRY